MTYSNLDPYGIKKKPLYIHYIMVTYMIFLDQVLNLYPCNAILQHTYLVLYTVLVTALSSPWTGLQECGHFSYTVNWPMNSLKQHINFMLTALWRWIHCPFDYFGAWIIIGNKCIALKIWKHSSNLDLPCLSALANGLDSTWSSTQSIQPPTSNLQ